MTGQRNPIDLLIGRRIHDFRVARGLTQTGMAVNLGFDATLIAAYENGDQRVPAQHLLAISRYLSIETSAFFELPQSSALHIFPRKSAKINLKYQYSASLHKIHTT